MEKVRFVWNQMRLSRVKQRLPILIPRKAMFFFYFLKKYQWDLKKYRLHHSIFVSTVLGGCMKGSVKR